MNGSQAFGSIPAPLQIVEGSLCFTFSANCSVASYDTWTFYRQHFIKVGAGLKGIDILCAQGSTLWLIEVKDYRLQRRTKPTDIVDEVAGKVVSTLAGIFAAASTAHNEEEKSLAQRCKAARDIRVVLHLEQPRTHSKLFPQAVAIANLLMKLKKQLKAIDRIPALSKCAL